MREVAGRLHACESCLLHPPRPLTALSALHFVFLYLTPLPLPPHGCHSPSHFCPDRWHHHPHSPLKPLPPSHTYFETQILCPVCLCQPPPRAHYLWHYYMLCQRVGMMRQGLLGCCCYYRAAAGAAGAAGAAAAAAVAAAAAAAAAS